MFLFGILTFFDRLIHGLLDTHDKGLISHVFLNRDFKYLSLCICDLCYPDH